MIRKQKLFVGVIFFCLAFPAGGLAQCKRITRTCNYGDNGHCVKVGTRFRYYADKSGETSCNETPYPCNCRPCNCYSCGCDKDGKNCSTCCDTCCDTCCQSCTPPPCPQSDQSKDNDMDGWEDHCEDCDPSNPRVHPFASNPFCDCNPNTPPPYHSTKGIPEFTKCRLIKGDDGNFYLSEGCLCLDKKDNDCDGLIDFKDPDCPTPRDLIVDTYVELDESKNISPYGLYVTSSGRLKILSGITLTVGKLKGVHIEPGGKIQKEPGARIELR